LEVARLDALQDDGCARHAIDRAFLDTLHYGAQSPVPLQVNGSAQ
jgi:hypothetical protein